MAVFRPPYVTCERDGDLDGSKWWSYVSTAVKFRHLPVRPQVGPHFIIPWVLNDYHLYQNVHVYMVERGEDENFLHVASSINPFLRVKLYRRK